MKQVVLVQHAIGEISVDNFAVVDMELPELQDGEYLVKNIYCGTDPYMRISMNPGEVFPNYPMVTLNEGIPGESVGEVIESKNEDFPKTDEHIACIQSGYCRNHKFTNQGPHVL